MAEILIFATLRFIGDGVNPQHIQRLLKVPGAEMYQKGSSEIGGSDRLSPTNGWLIDSDLESEESIDRHIHRLAEKVIHAERFFEELASLYGPAEFFCSVNIMEKEGSCAALCSISNESIRLLSRLSARLELDIKFV